MDVACMDDPKQDFVKAFPGTIKAFGPALSGYGYSPKYVPWLRENAHNYDAVIVHGLWQYPGFATWLALHKGPIPYVVFAHGMLDPWFKQTYPFRHFKKSVYWAIAEHRVLQDAQAVLFTSEEEAIAARQTFQPYEAKDIVIGLGASEPVGNANEQKEIFLRQFPGLRNQRIILFLGRLHEKKGCLPLLSSLAEILTDNPEKYADLHLVMAGAGQAVYEEQLKEYVARTPALANRLTWTGFISGDLKWGALHAADVLILPSHQENFAVVVTEALACSKPVLISDKVNIWQDILEDGAALVEPDDPAGTKRLLLRWLSLSETEQKDMQENAKRCFGQKFEIRLVYDRLISLLEEFVCSANKEV